MLTALQRALADLDTLPVNAAGLPVNANDGVIGRWQLGQALDLAVAVLSRVAADSDQFLTFEQLQRLLNAKADKLPDKPSPDDPIFDPPGMRYDNDTERLIARRYRYQQALNRYHEALHAAQEKTQRADHLRRHYGYGAGQYLRYADDALAQLSSLGPVASALSSTVSTANPSTSAPSMTQAFLSAPRSLPIPEASARYGTFIVGNHGSGKTEVIKHRVWHYLTKPDLRETIIVFDPHGEMAPEIARMKPNFGSDRLVYIDPTLEPGFVSSPKVLNTNDKSADNLFREAEHYGEALRMISGSLEPSASGNMESICRNCAHVVLEHDHYNLKDLMDLLAVEPPKKDRPQRDVPQIYHDACETSSNLEIQQHFQHSFLYGNYGMAKNALLGRMERIVAAPVLQRMLLSPPTFDLGELINHRKVIVINLPMGQLTDSVTGMIGQLLMAQITAAVMKRDLTRIDDYPLVHVFIDEAQHFCSHETAKQINELRKYGFSLTLATQYVDQFPSAILEAVKGLGVQIAGYCIGKNLTAMNAVFDLSAKTKDHDESTVLQRQSVGQFHFRARGAQGAPEVKTRQFTTATNLIYKGAEWRERNADRYMTEAEWEATKARQLADYYQPITVREPAAQSTKPRANETNAQTAADDEAGNVSRAASPLEPSQGQGNTKSATAPSQRSKKSKVTSLDDLPPLQPTKGHG